MLDLDGTIVHAGVDVSPAVCAALGHAHELGCVLAVSSGRPLGMMPRSVLRMGVMDYYLCANGAKVYDRSGAELFSNDMGRDEVKQLIEALVPFGARWNVHSGGHSWIERNGVSYMIAEATPKKLKQLVPRSPRHLRSIALSLVHRFVGERGKRIVRSILPVVDSHERFEKVGCSFPSAQACEDAAALARGLGIFEVARVWDCELEITSAGVSKGTTADWLMAHLGIERARSVAFGDSMNDAPLIGHVGRFVAVGNASDDLKELSDEVCATLSEDGVARWLEEQMEEASAADAADN